MREIKIQVLFEVYNKDFSKSIKRHYTTVDRLMSGDDTFDYINGPEVIAKRQFTGLKDKSGVEIYEGDILAHPKQGSRKVIYPMSENTACFGLESKDGWKNTLQDSEALYEIIGNIYEYPDCF